MDRFVPFKKVCASTPELKVERPPSGLAQPAERPLGREAMGSISAREKEDGADPLDEVVWYGWRGADPKGLCTLELE
jgi:hypothetical protein